MLCLMNFKAEVFLMHICKLGILGFIQNVQMHTDSSILKNRHFISMYWH